MGADPFAAKIAYACIFSTSIDDAARNLVRLISTRTCGFDEGTDAWRKAMKTYLDSAEDIFRFL